MSVFVITVLLIVASFAISFFATAGVIWLLIWALTALGVTTIGPFVVAFSWPLVLAVWLILMLVQSVFHVTVSR